MVPDSSVNTGKGWALVWQREHGEFEQEGGVEYTAGIFLVGEYPFCPSPARTLGQREMVPGRVAG